jgi:glycosyltransferase involved in cell wall biosynthesis
MALAGELGVADNVVFMGRLPHAGALAHMAGCDIFVLPSWNDDFGVVYLEALGLGKPVIGCRGQGVEDMVEDGRTGYLVEPRDTESLARTILHILNNGTESARVAAAAREKVLSSFTWEQNACRYTDVYLRCIKKG